MVVHNIPRSKLDLDKTFNCGQCFRWEKQSDGSWIGIINNNIFSLKHIIVDGVECIETNATEEEWNNILYNYLDLDTDYDISILDTYDHNKKSMIYTSDTFAIKAMKAGAGIRILRQDPWEAIISFIISQRNNIPKIKSTIHNMCVKHGNMINKTINSREYIGYTFPKPDKLTDITKLTGIGLGYRDEYVSRAALVMEEYPEFMSYITSGNIDTDGVIYKLQELKGVGPKVANCIALFGLHRLDAFPVDVWMQRIIDQYYDGNLDYTVYGNLAGLVQQYMFYYIKYTNT